jgi:integrase
MATKKAGSEPTPGEIIKGLEPGPFLTLCKISPAGALQVRKAKTGAVSFFWRYTHGGSTERMSIGTYDASPGHINKHEATDKGFSVAAAIKAAQALAIKHANNKDKGGLPALIAEEEAAKAAAKAAEEAAAAQAAKAAAEAAAAQEAAQKYSLKALLLDYCDHLKALGRRSHTDARSIFTLHVFDVWPVVAATPARLVEIEQIADMMRKLHEAGKGRTANKLRSYTRAAFQVAKDARSNPKIPVRFKGYGVTINIASEVAPDTDANKPAKHPLSVEELRTYWQAIKPVTGLKGAALRLHLLTGGQRLEQLVTLHTADTTANTITLYDGKGRPGKAPRPHTLPLIPEAAQALAECAPAGLYALSSDPGEKKGTTHIAATTLARWAQEVAAGAGIEGFQAKRIRSGVETLLAARGVTQDIRGRLQSHGISGVQAAHYDGHHYLPEKESALLALFKALNAPSDAGKESNVYKLPSVA